MTSPSAPSRRLQRSARLVVAGVLLLLAVAAVVAAAVSGSWLVATIAAAVGVLLGAVATRITYTEVADTRRAWARDRAEQAQAYRDLTEVRTEEQAVYVADTQGRIARHEATIARLEERLAAATDEVIAARDELAAEHERAMRAERAEASAVADRERLAVRLDEAEERAAMAIVRVAELEHELDVVLAEWHAGSAAPARKHA
jgi:uncharacterized membrane-anchored protein YhcB (DUF1043 family)